MNYSVVAFPAGHPLATSSHFLRLGADLLRNSFFQAGPLLAQMERAQIQKVEVLVLSEYSSKFRKEIEAEIEAKIAEAKKRGSSGGVMLGGGIFPKLPAGRPEKIPIPEEYQGYDKVYFLNELAVQMYRDGKVEFEVLKTIAAEELPENCSRCLRGPYIPISAEE